MTVERMESHLVRLCREQMERLGISQNQAARRIGYSSAVLTGWLRGTYGGDVEAVEERVQMWLAAEHALLSSGIAAVPPPRHVMLNVTGSVVQHLAMSHHTGDAMAVTGPAGTGKTFAAQYYCAMRRDARYVRMPHSVTTLRGVFRVIARALKLDDRRRSALDLEFEIVKALGSPALLVIDDAHVLPPRFLNALRSPCGGAGCGLALLGRNELGDTVERCSDLRGDVAGIADLGSPSTDDVRMLVEDEIDGAVTAGAVSAVTGGDFNVRGLNAVRHHLTVARMRARAEGRDRVTARDVVATVLGVPHVVADADAAPLLEKTA